MVAVGTTSCSSSSRFGPSSGFNGHAGDVAARPVQAGDEADLDRVAANHEDDRNGCGRRLCSECRSRCRRPR